MKYNVQTFARKKGGIDLQQVIACGTNFNSLEQLLTEYAERYYKHKTAFEKNGNETNCMH